MKYVPSDTAFVKGQPKEWFLIERTQVVTLPDGENVAVPMTNWHWMALDWICTRGDGTLRNTLETIVEAAEHEGMDLVDAMKEFIAEYMLIILDKGEDDDDLLDEIRSGGMEEAA